MRACKHIGLEGRRSSKRFERQHVQCRVAPPKIAHRRRKCPKAEQPDRIGEFQELCFGLSSTVLREPSKRAGQDAGGIAREIRTAKPEVPVAGGVEFGSRSKSTDALMSEKRPEKSIIDENVTHTLARSGSPNPLAASSQVSSVMLESISARSRLIPPGNRMTMSPRSMWPTTPPSSRCQRCRVAAGRLICPLDDTFDSPRFAIRPVYKA